jgi:hypothetical protein
MVVISVALLRRQFAAIRNLSIVLLALAALGFYPLLIGIVEGQDSSLLLLLTVFALVATCEKRDVAAGIALGLGLFKFHLVGPLAVVLAARKPKILIGLIPTAAVLAGISIAMLGGEGTVSYVRFILRLENSGAGGAISAFGMPNLRGLLSVATGHRQTGGPGAWLVIAISVALLLVAGWRATASRTSVPQAFSLATAAAVLVSYHAMPYDLTLMFPLVLLTLSAFCSGASYPLHAAFLLLTFLSPLYIFLTIRTDRLGLLALIPIWLFWWSGWSSSSNLCSGWSEGNLQLE